MIKHRNDRFAILVNFQEWMFTSGFRLAGSKLPVNSQSCQKVFDHKNNLTVFSRFMLLQQKVCVDLSSISRNVGTISFPCRWISIHSGQWQSKQPLCGRVWKLMLIWYMPPELRNNIGSENWRIPFIGCMYDIELTNSNYSPLWSIIQLNYGNEIVIFQPLTPIHI